MIGSAVVPQNHVLHADLPGRSQLDIAPGPAGPPQETVILFPSLE